MQMRNLHLLPPLIDLPLGLVLIRQKALVGHLPGNHKVYKITKIAVIPLSDEEPLELELEVRLAAERRRRDWILNVGRKR